MRFCLAIAAAAFVALLASGCALLPQDEAFLHDTAWRLVEYRADDGEVRPVQLAVERRRGDAGSGRDEPRLTLELSSEGSATGEASRNLFWGAWSSGGDGRLTIERLRTTKMEPGSSRQRELEGDYLGYLERTQRFRVRNEMLELLDDDGTLLLRFEASEPPPSLPGTQWRVTRMRDASGGSYPVSVPVTMRFEQAEALTGTVVEWHYQVAYRQEGVRTISVESPTNFRKTGRATPSASSDSGGGEDPVGDFLRTLPSLAYYRIDGEVLELFDERGRAAVYARRVTGRATGE